MNIAETIKAAQEDFWKKNGNPDTFSSRSQFHPDIAGQLGRVINEAITTTAQAAYEAGREAIVEKLYREEERLWSEHKRGEHEYAPGVSHSIKIIEALPSNQEK